MNKVIIIFLLLASRMPLHAQEKIDTLKISGTCQYVGMTGSIIATNYFKFKIEEVLEGTFEGKTIVFESSINSQQHKLFDQIKMGKKIDSPKTIFPITMVPVNQCFVCKSKSLVIQLQRLEEEIPNGKKLIQYFYLRE